MFLAVTMNIIYEEVGPYRLSRKSSQESVGSRKSSSESSVKNDSTDDKKGDTNTPPRRKRKVGIYGPPNDPIYNNIPIIVVADTVDVSDYESQHLIISRLDNQLSLVKSSSRPHNIGVTDRIVTQSDGGQPLQNLKSVHNSKAELNDGKCGQDHLLVSETEGVITESKPDHNNIVMYGRRQVLLSTDSIVEDTPWKSMEERYPETYTDMNSTYSDEGNQESENTEDCFTPLIDFSRLRKISRADQSDMVTLKDMTNRLNLNPRRPSYLVWKAKHVHDNYTDTDNNVCAKSPVDSCNKNKDGAGWTSERKESIDNALDWLRTELVSILYDHALYSSECCCCCCCCLR